VVRHPRPVLLGQHLALPLQTADHAVGGGVKVGDLDRLLVRARRHQRALVADVRHLGAREAGRERGERLRDLVDVVGEFELREVDAEDLGAAARGGRREAEV
jgi:hypothetical protein